LGVRQPTFDPARILALLGAAVQFGHHVVLCPWVHVVYACGGAAGTIAVYLGPTNLWEFMVYMEFIVTGEMSE